MDMYVFALADPGADTDPDPPGVVVLGTRRGVVIVGVVGLGVRLRLRLASELAGLGPDVLAALACDRPSFTLSLSGTAGELIGVRLVVLAFMLPPLVMFVVFVALVPVEGVPVAVASLGPIAGGEFKLGLMLVPAFMSKLARLEMDGRLL
jgi:hypothetical protein